jgi:hypothetical protein
MNWQTKLGRTDEARNTLLGINTLEEKQKEEKTKREGQARAAGVAEYQKALKAGDDDAIAAAEDAMYRIGEVQGIDVTNLLSGVEQRAYAASDQEYQEKERARLGEERGTAAKEKQEADALAVAFGKAATLEEANAFLEGAPPSAAILAQQLYNNAETRITNQIDRDREESALKAPIQKVSIIIPDGIPAALKTNFEKTQEAIDKDIDALNKRLQNGDLLFATEGRDALMARRRSLENRVTEETDRLLVAADVEEKAAKKETAKQIRDLERRKRAPLEQAGIGSLAKAIAGVDKKGKQNPVTPAHIGEARRQMREMRNNDLDTTIEFLRNPEGVEGNDDLGGPEIGTVVDGMEYQGGDPNDNANWQPVGTSSASTPEASAVNSGVNSEGYVTGRSGGQNKGIVSQRLGESAEALVGSASRGLESLAGLIPDSVPMYQNPGYYGNYQQEQ